MAPWVKQWFWPRALRPQRERIVFCLALVVMVTFACTGGSSEPRATVTVGTQETPAPTIDPFGPQGNLRETIGNAVLACLEKNVTLVRSFIAGETTDAEIEAMFARGSGVRLLAQDGDPAIEDGMATVEVSLDVGADEPLEREWELERGDDGLWRFTSLPDCY